MRKRIGRTTRELHHRSTPGGLAVDGQPAARVASPRVAGKSAPTNSGGYPVNRDEQSNPAQPASLIGGALPTFTPWDTKPVEMMGRNLAPPCARPQGGAPHQTTEPTWA